MTPEGPPPNDDDNEEKENTPDIKDNREQSLRVSNQGDFYFDDSEYDYSQFDDPLAFLRWRRKPDAFIFLNPDQIVKEDGQAKVQKDPIYKTEPHKLKKYEDEEAPPAPVKGPVVMKENTFINPPGGPLSGDKSGKSRRGSKSLRGRKKFGRL